MIGGGSESILSGHKFRSISTDDIDISMYWSYARVDDSIKLVRETRIEMI